MHPGHTRTERMQPEDEAGAAQAHTARRIIDASEIATLVAFLASPHSTALNGKALNAVGGTPGVIRYWRPQAIGDAMSTSVYDIDLQRLEGQAAARARHDPLFAHLKAARPRPDGGLALARGEPKTPPSDLAADIERALGPSSR